MTIVSQNYNEMIKNLIINEISKATINLTLNFIENVNNYINLVKSFDEAVNKSIILAIQSYIENLDYEYTNSYERKQKYDIKDYCERTILTIFGEITIKRHFFKSKLNGKSFCYIDRKLGLKKYQYFDILVNFIKNNNPKREDIINKKYDYIISNWKVIQNLYKYKMSCPMESQISHNIASLTSSRPKGYSHKMLDKILNLRLKNVNKQNKVNYIIKES